MKNVKEELFAALPGLREGMPEELFLLARIFECHVFELYSAEETEGETYYIPYMMNDALECYLVLEHACIKGKYLPDMQEETYALLVQQEEKYGLIVKQGEEHTFTVWFQMIRKSLTCYQYHKIGHFWVRGQEQWRRLVYIFGTLYDKYKYLGNEVCNEKELRLLRLMECPAFRYYSPISENLSDWYPDSREGRAMFQKLAQKSGDRSYARLLKWYVKFPNTILEKLITYKMQSPRRQKLYEYLVEMTEQASMEWNTRSYSEELEKHMRNRRKALDQELREKGFAGQYPYYQREKMWITVMEEHPFTVMETESFTFSLHLMVSEGKRKPALREAGFFRGRGAAGKIIANAEKVKMCF